jgi:hypothetical protein
MPDGLRGDRITSNTGHDGGAYLRTRGAGSSFGIASHHEARRPPRVLPRRSVILRSAATEQPNVSPRHPALPMGPLPAAVNRRPRQNSDCASLPTIDPRKFKFEFV